jgi:hypothetical protein
MMGKDVILVLCGWAGSRDKHLLVYEELLRHILSQIHKHARVQSIRCSLPMHLIFSPVEALRTAWVRENVVRPLEECANSPEESSSMVVLIQAFSNGGGFVVEQLQKIYGLGQRPRLPRIAGIVFDSSPGYDRGNMGKRVLEEVIGTGSWYQRVGIHILHGSQRMAGRLLNSSRQRDYWKAMTDVGGLCPTLHLYSMDDHLCDPNKLYELIMDKVGRGMDVQHFCWDVSAHCRHYQLHKEEYEAAMSLFLVKAIGPQGRGTVSRL